MEKVITGSVGKGCKNDPADVEVIQTLLNLAAKKAGFRKLKVDGLVGKKTITTIRAYQELIGAKKVTGKVLPNKVTHKALMKGQAAVVKAIKEQPPPPPKTPGKVKGNVSGVNTKIVGVLEAVAAHYGKDIPISSGKRNPSDQARAMWNNWTGNLKRGEIYTYLKGSGKKFREELDQCFEKKDRKKFDEIVKKIAPHLSLHLKGEAVDVAPKSALDPKMLAAIKKYLRVLVEKSCYHLDTQGKSPPSSISDKDRVGWP